MTIREQLVEQLAAASVWGYHHDGAAATEPTAMAALALTHAGKTEAARRALTWLADHQNRNGSLGVTATESTPTWPTTLAIMAWTVAGGGYDDHRQKAIDWMLSIRGEPVPQAKLLGHDSTLVGWPWVVPTHSWSEPTAFSVLALQAADHADHPRCQEAVTLLIDRLLPEGGSNYGNTTVLGQTLRPHIMPTGVVLWAIAGAAREPGDVDPRIAHSLDYLESQLAEPISAAALAYTTLALSAHGRSLDAAKEALTTVATRHLEATTLAAPWKLALLATAALEIDAVADRGLLRPSLLQPVTLMPATPNPQ